MKKLALCCLLAASVSQNFAIAANQPTKEESTNYSLNNYAQTGVILGVQAGYSFWESTYTSTYKSGNIYRDKDKMNRYMFGMLIGYDFALTDYINLGLESGFQYANTITINYDWDGNAFQRDHYWEKKSLYSIPVVISGKFFVPDMNGLHFILKAGAIWEHAVEKHSYSSSQSIFVENTIKTIFGGGVGFKFQNTAISLQCLNYKGADSDGWGDNGEKNHLVITLGLTYTLPF